MIIVASFEQSIELEQVLAVLENKFVSRNQILVIFMDNEALPIQMFGRTRDIRSNAFEVGLASATGSAVIGASIGFEMILGPILCGLIAAFSGFGIGFGIYYFLKRQKSQTNVPKKTEVTVIIQCSKNQSNQIKEELWKYQALSVGESNPIP